MNIKQLTPAELAGYVYLKGTATDVEAALLAALEKVLLANLSLEEKLDYRFKGGAT